MDSLNLEINKFMLSEVKYACTRGTVGSFINELLAGNLTNYSIANFVQNDSDYISKIAYYPILITPFVSSSSSGQNIKIGTQTAVNITGKEILTTKEYVQILSNITKTREHNNFMDFEPYTTFTLYVPFFEKIDIPCFYVYAGFNAYMSVDFSSGNATLYITDTNGKMIQTKNTIISVELPIGASNRQEQQRNNVLQLISLAGSVAGAVVGVASGNPLITAGSIGLGVKNVTQYLQNNVDKFNGKGGTGHRDSMACDKDIILFKETVQNITLPSASLVGRPLKENRSLNTLTGFTKVGDIHFNPKGADIYNDEISEIVTLLQNGVIL